MNGFTISQGKWDTRVAEFFATKILPRWASLTGKNNIYLARVLLVAGYLSMQLEAALLLIFGKGIPWGASFAVVVWSWLLWIRWKEVDKCADMAEHFASGSNMLRAEDITTATSIVSVRKLWLFLGVVCLPLSIVMDKNPLFEIGMSLQALGLYAALTFHGGGKSVWARAKEKVASWVENLQWQPALQPVSIHMGGRNGISQDQLHLQAWRTRPLPRR